MDTRTERLLAELRKCTLADRLQVIQALIKDMATSGSRTPPQLSVEEMAELQRRIDTIDQSYELDEFIAALDREVKSRAEGS